MTTSGIPYRDTGYFSSLLTDYLEQNPKLDFTYGRFPTLDQLKAQAQEKCAAFPEAHRQVLVEVLQEQYATLDAAPEVAKNISALGSKNAVTLTTGHQLCLLTGPLYFIYKILTIIKLAEQLRAQAPELEVVPVYWMATEDHDFEEISSFQFQQQKFQWTKAAEGPVGRMNLEGLAPVLEAFSKVLGKTLHAKKLLDSIANSYGSASTLAEATRCLVNGLFASYGLVVIDADHPKLKTLFRPQVHRELTEQLAHAKVQEQVEKIKQDYNSSYKPQVAPRALNLFYFYDGGRYRIEKEEDNYLLVGTSKVFSQQALLQELEAHPENFSPNVLLRPLYQEVILPNIAYIGGGGELAYWLELKSFFDASNVLFPILLLRNAALVLTPKDVKKCKALGVDPKQLFLSRTALLAQKTKALSELDINLQFFKDTLEAQFKTLEAIAKKTDASFIGSVAAQRAKQFKGIDRLEQRLLRAEKRKFKAQLQRLSNLHERLFPKGNLQERVLNFSSFYCDYGPDFIAQLYREFDPLGQDFTILTTGE